MVGEFVLLLVSSSVRCTSSVSSLSDKENPATPFTPCSSIPRVPLSTMENHGEGVITTPSSSFTATKRPSKRSYADAVQPSRAKRTNSSLPCTPTNEDTFSPSSSSCSSDLRTGVVDECTPEANEKYETLSLCCTNSMCIWYVLRCEGSCMVHAQRRLSFTEQRTLSRYSLRMASLILSLL